MSLELARERTVQTLCAHYAQDHLTTQELEARFEAAYRAASAEELRALTLSLPALPPSAAAAGAVPMFTVATPAPAEKRYLAIMSDVRRQGRWVVPSRVKAVCWMGAIRLDLREAQIPEGGLEIDATVVMGELRIVLPPGLHADVDGMAIMGEFSNRTVGSAA